MLSSRRHHYVARISIFLVAVALIVGMVGCGPDVVFSLYISSTAGGSVTTPGEGQFHYLVLEVVKLVATPDPGYRFDTWSGNTSTIANVNDATTNITIYYSYFITANFEPEILEIWDWYDLDAVKNNLSGSYLLMNNLDSTTPGYTELASPTANGGKGWQPIGSIEYNQSWGLVNPFIGTFDGQGYEIRQLFIDRPDESGVALFGAIEGGVVKNVEVMNANVTGLFGVGILVGGSAGNVSNSYSTGDVSGAVGVGGLVGWNDYGTVDSSYSTGSVTGNSTGSGYECSMAVGGLVGLNDHGTVDSSYSTGSMIGDGTTVGGLVGYNDEGTVSNSYSTGSVSGIDSVGGLVGSNWGTVSNSYSTGNVSGTVDVGGLVGCNDYGTVDSSYSTGSVTGHLSAGGLVGWNDSTVTNSYSTGSVSGNDSVGGLVGGNGRSGTVTNSYSTGSVSGNGTVGGLVGNNWGTVSNSYSTGSVSGNGTVGGLVGYNDGGTVSNSFWDTETSGQAASDGGTGKTTAEMQDIATFSGAGWDIIAVANPSTRNLTYIWNIVDDETYPFLSWQL
jgi:hypothetical protein